MTNTHDYSIANQTFPNTRTDINNVLADIQSTNSGASAPTTSVPFKLWADSTNNVMKIRNAADSAHISLLNISGDLVVSKTTTATLTIADLQRLVLADSTGGVFTITMPAASAFPEGGTLSFRRSAGTATVTLARAGSDRFYWPTNDTAGYTSVVLPTIGDTLTVMSNGTDSWYVVADGIDGPRFEARSAGGETMTSVTYTKIVFNTESIDTHAAYDPTTNYRFTPLVPGYYSVNIIGAIDSVADGKLWTVAVYKNGTITKQNGGYSGATGTLLAEISYELFMNGTTDYLEAFGFNGDATGRLISASATNTLFQANRVK